MYVYIAIASALLGVVTAFQYQHLATFYFILGIVVPTMVIRKQILVLIAFFFIIGLLRADYVIKDITPIQYDLLGVTTTHVGEIVDEPDIREKVTHYVVHISEQDSDVRVTMPHYPRLHYGDVVELIGRLELPENFTNERGITFDYINFLLKNDIQYTMYFPKVTVLEQGQGNWLKEKLFASKYWFLAGLNNVLPAQHAALAGGILLGAKQSLGSGMLTAFQRVGLIHIVVLSGYNVTIIGDAIQKAMSIFPRNIAFGGSVFAVVCFAMLTGASATTVRSTIMAVIALVGRHHRKTYSVYRALWIAAFLMVMHNPRILLYDPGFQLSFVATLGLLHISPLFERWLENLRVPNTFTLREILAATISTQIAVLPLLIKMTGEVSIVSLLANVLVLPTMPLAMAVSALSGALHWAGLVSVPIHAVTYVLHSYTFFITEWLAEVPFAVIAI